MLRRIFKLPRSNPERYVNLVFEDLTRDCEALNIGRLLDFVGPVHGM